MDRPKVAIIVVVVLVILAGLFIVLSGRPNSDSAPAQTPPAPTSAEPTAPTPTPTTPEEMKPSSSNGSYSDYSATSLAAASGKTKVLFFYANWCPSCRQQDTNLSSSAADIPSDLVIFKVNYDGEIALRQKYGVTIQHTFVEVDDNGNEVQQWNSLYQQNNLQGILDKVN